MKILAVVDDKPSAVAALKTAAAYAERLGAPLGVVTVRHGTHATESAPPVGVDIPAGERESLSPGIRVLLAAADSLARSGLLVPLTRVRLRDVPHGRLFAGQRANTGERVIFGEHFGNLIDELNREIDESGYNLVVIAAPRRGPLGRFVPMNVARRLALGLHCSFLVVRRGGPDGRFLVCADGSPSARRIFPFLKKLLPAVRGATDLICVRRPQPDPEEIAQAEHCLALAHNWLSRCGRKTKVLQPTGAKRFKLILEEAGKDAVIVMGESHMHDVRRRTFGSLPMKVLARTDSSFLLVKQPTEPDPEMFEDTFAC